MLALRTGVRPTLMADQGREKGPTCQYLDKGHRHLRERLLVIPISDDSPNQHCPLGYFSVLNVWLCGDRVLSSYGWSSFDAVFDK